MLLRMSGVKGYHHMVNNPASKRNRLLQTITPAMSTYVSHKVLNKITVSHIYCI